MKRLNNICIPTIKSEKKTLLQNFILWDNTCFDNVERENKLNLIISLNNGLDTAYSDEVEKVFSICPNLRSVFKKIIYYNCQLSKAEDLYITKPSEGQQYPKGYKTGPNNQFFKTMKYLNRYEGASLYVETDCTIVNNSFIDNINETISTYPDFYTIGSMYKGKGKLHNNIVEHINGNAIYNTGSKAFISFLNEVWEPYTHNIGATFPHIAYDITIEYAKSQNILSQNILDEIDGKFIAHNLIQNHGGPKDMDGNGKPLENILENQETAIVHGRHLTSQYVQMLSKNYEIKEDPEKRPILIYQMGKVGSTTICSALQDAYPDRTIMHIHCLDKEELDRYESHLNKSGLLNKGHRHLLDESRKGIQLVRSGKPYNVITLTRDHVARTISYFFENLGSILYQFNAAIPLFTFDDQSVSQINKVLIRNEKFEAHNEIVRLLTSKVSGKRFKNYNNLDGFLIKQSGKPNFVEKYKRSFYRFGYNQEILSYLLDAFYKSLESSLEVMRWYDTEFNINLGIDIFQFLFNPTDGFTHCKKDESNFIVMQSELDNEMKAKYLTEHFPKLNMDTNKSGNVSIHKHYSELYKAFKKEVVFEEEYLDKVYNSKYMRYFYTQDQLQAFRMKWNQKT